MATFKACVQKERRDGFFPVYIRVTHHRRTKYIKTDKLVTRKYLTKSGEITDPYVMQYCARTILEYVERLNRTDTAAWTVEEVVAFLLAADDDVCFSDYAREHIRRLYDRESTDSTVSLYRTALRNLERFAGTEKVMCRQLTSRFVEAWVASLAATRRAKELYPVCIRQMFNAAVLKYNDHDRGVIHIKTNPWLRVEIPRSDIPDKRAITPEACRVFFSFPLPVGRKPHPAAELGRDVAMFVLCLAGINAIDLFHLRPCDYDAGIIRYRRMKTRHARADGAYMEMRVPPILGELFAKYRDTDPASPRLFNFHRRFSSYRAFRTVAGLGISRICAAMGLPRERWYSTYTFRHTWGTVAQNDCGASIDDVAFAMNHGSSHRITRGYIKIDYAPAWELNEKVVDFIFFSGLPSARERRKDAARFHLHPGTRVRAAAYHGGHPVASFEGAGFTGVAAVVARLAAMLPSSIPSGAVVMFRIEDTGSGLAHVCSRTKGQDF